jgi:ankyrin repeat protein
MGAEVNAVNRIGDTALYLAAENGHTYTVKALIDLGAEVNTANLGGWTPLMMTAARGDLETISLLLEHGADFRPRNRWGATALSEARNSFRANQATELLMRAGAME